MFDNDDKLKIGDFIQTRILEEGNRIVEFNPYMSPELVRFHFTNEINYHAISHKTDIWFVIKINRNIFLNFFHFIFKSRSVGIIIYELKTLKNPFKVDNLSHESATAHILRYESPAYLDLRSPLEQLSDIVKK